MKSFTITEAQFAALRKLQFSLEFHEHYKYAQIIEDVLNDIEASEEPSVEGANKLNHEALVKAAREGKALGTCDED